MLRKTDNALTLELTPTAVDAARAVAASWSSWHELDDLIGVAVTLLCETLVPAIQAGRVRNPYGFAYSLARMSASNMSSDLGGGN